MATTPLGIQVQAVLRQPVLDAIFEETLASGLDLAKVVTLTLELHKATSEALILIADAIDHRP